MRITANVRPEFGLHGLFKLTRKVSTVVPNKGSIVSPIFFVLILYEFVHSVFKDGKTLGSGGVCWRELMRKQEHAMAVEQTETEDRKPTSDPFLSAQRKPLQKPRGAASRATGALKKSFEMHKIEKLTQRIEKDMENVLQPHL